MVHVLTMFVFAIPIGLASGVMLIFAQQSVNTEIVSPMVHVSALMIGSANGAIVQRASTALV
jgi:hypothetical protein